MADQELTNEMYAVLEEACSLYQKNLPGSPAEEHLRKRGIGPNMVNKFRLGYSPNRNNLSDRRRFPELATKTAGLITEPSEARFADGDTYFDFFRGRLMFPIFDSQGRVVSFGGRTLLSKDEQRKQGTPSYMNTRATPLYEKSKILYGLNFLSQIPSTTPGFIYVFEGYADVVQAHKVGVENVVAPCGTAFTLEQAKLLERRFPRRTIVLCFDGDEQGQDNATRVAGKMLGRGNLEICVMPLNEDPASIVEKNMPLSPILEKRYGLFRFYLGSKARTFGLTYEELRNADEEKVIALLQDIKHDFREIPDERRPIYEQGLVRATGRGIEKIGKIIYGGNWRPPKSESPTNHGVIYNTKKEIRKWEVRFVRQLMVDPNPLLAVGYFADQLGIKPDMFQNRDVGSLYELLVVEREKLPSLIKSPQKGRLVERVSQVLEMAKAKQIDLDEEKVEDILRFNSKTVRARNRQDLENSLLWALCHTVPEKMMHRREMGATIDQVLEDISYIGRDHEI